MMNPRRLQLWIPELAGPGGIQAFSRALVQACAELLPDAAIRVLVRNGPMLLNPVWRNVAGQTAGGSPLFLRRTAYAGLLSWAVVRDRPDLVIITHLHFAPMARWLQRFVRFRYWIVVHGIEAWTGLTTPRRRALRQAEKILPVSEYTSLRLSQECPGLSVPMHRLPNTVDESCFTPGPKPLHLLRRYGLTREHRVLLTVARLDPRQRYKGCDLIIEALALMRDSSVPVHYLIVGRGADSCRLRQRVLSKGLQRHVTLTGFLPERELADHYRLCDLYAMPSQAEGFGIVFLEALACGRRVVAGNADGATEPLLGGTLGVLTDPHDAPALAQRLSRLLCEEPSPSESALLRDSVIEHFGSGAFRNRLHALFQTTCAA